jgi:hypothetical protein
MQALQSATMWRLLALCSPGQRPPSLLSQVHARYWLHEVRIHLYFKLLEAVPSAQEAFLKHLQSDAHSIEWGPALDFELVDLALSFLSPSTQHWTHVSQYAEWMSVYKYAKLAVDSVISLAQSGVQGGSNASLASDRFRSPARRTVSSVSASASAAVPSEALASPQSSSSSSSRSRRLGESVVAQWEKIRFSHIFVRDVATPLRLAPEQTLKTLSQVSSEVVHSLFS